MKPLRITALFSLPLCLTLAACSGNSGTGSNNTAQPRQATLLVDTTTANGASLRATLLGVVLENDQGQRTDNLVAGPTTLELGSPAPALAGIALRGLAGDRYAAMHLLLAADSVRAIDDRGQEQAVTVTQNALTVPFDEAAPIPSFVVLRHRGVFDLQRDAAGKLTWRPSLAARAATTHPVRDTVVSVLSTDRDRSQVMGEIAAAGRMPVIVSIGDDALLSSQSASGPQTRARFFDLLRLGSEIEVRGLLDDKGGLRLSHGDDLGLSSQRPESEVFGRITALDATTRIVQVQVLGVRRGATDLPRQPLPVLTVDAQAAKVRRSSSNETLAFGALTTGMFVEVEWRGAVTNNRVAAHEIEIEDGSDDRGFGPEIEGRIGEVKHVERSFVVVPRRDDPLLVGGKPVSAATVRLTSTTRILRRESSGDIAIDLSQVTTLDRVWIVGRLLDATVIEASLVRVRRE